MPETPMSTTGYQVALRAGVGAPTPLAPSNCTLPTRHVAASLGWSVVQAEARL